MAWQHFKAEFLCVCVQKTCFINALKKIKKGGIWQVWGSARFGNTICIFIMSQIIFSISSLTLHFTPFKALFYILDTFRNLMMQIFITSPILLFKTFLSKIFFHFKFYLGHVLFIKKLAKN